MQKKNEFLLLYSKSLELKRRIYYNKKETGICIFIIVIEYIQERVECAVT